jgi:quercetin dioxygenase-like cupin family protein
MMVMNQYQIKQLADEISIPDSGKKSIVIADDSKTRIVLFAFATGDGLAEHIAPMDAIIQIVTGTAILTIGSESVDGKPGTLIKMLPKTPHSIKATTPLVMLLTLIK